MTDQSIQRYAKDLISFVLKSFKDGDDYMDTAKQVESVIRLAITESSEDKDEVIRRLADRKSLTPAQKSEVIRIYNQ